MSNKILIVGALAVMSAVAVAQSDQSKDKARAQEQSVAPRDAASGQATGKRVHNPMTVTKGGSARETDPGKATGKPMASDDWQTSAAKTTQPKIVENKSQVAVGEINGDGKADLAAPNKPGQATVQNTSGSSASSDVKSPRDVATGQSTGRRQHEPTTATKDSETKTKK
jgi:hypothetical protein